MLVMRRVYLATTVHTCTLYVIGVHWDGFPQVEEDEPFELSCTCTCILYCTLQGDNTPEELVEQLREIEAQLLQLSRDYNIKKVEFEKTNEDIKKMRIEILAQKEVISMLEDGIKEHKKLQQNCPTQHMAV